MLFTQVHSVLQLQLLSHCSSWWFLQYICLSLKTVCFQACSCRHFFPSWNILVRIFKISLRIGPPIWEMRTAYLTFLSILENPILPSCKVRTKRVKNIYFQAITLQEFLHTRWIKYVQKHLQYVDLNADLIRKRPLYMQGNAILKEHFNLLVCLGFQIFSNGKSQTF